MTEEELKKLAKKVSSGEASYAEELIILQETNNVVTDIYNDLESLKSNKIKANN